MTEERIISYTDLLQRRDIQFPFPVQQIGYLRSIGYERLNMPGYDFVEFCFRLKSEEEEAACDFLNGKKFVYPFPHLFIKMPNRRHSFTIRGHRHALYLQYSAKLIPQFLANGIPLDLPGMAFERTAEIDETIKGLRDLILCSQQRGMAERIDLGAYKLITLVLLQKDADKRRDSRIRNVAAYLCAHFNEHFNFDELCERFSISRRSLFRDWEKFYPGSPQSYLAYLRMQKAVALLADRTLQIQEIGEMVGYSNTAYFIQVFRRQYGCSPGRYRNRIFATDEVDAGTG